MLKKIIYTLCFLNIMSLYAMAENVPTDNFSDNTSSLSGSINDNSSVYVHKFIAGKYLSHNYEPKSETAYETYLAEGKSVEDAIEIIVRAFNDNRRQFISESIFNRGYNFKSGNDTQLTCSDFFINNKEDIVDQSKPFEYINDDYYKHNYITYNRSLLKARETIFSKIMYGHKGEDNEYFLFMGLTYLLEDGLYDFDNVTKYFKEYLSQSKSIEKLAADLFQTEKEQKYFINLIKSIAEMDTGIDIEGFINFAKENGFLSRVAFSNGVFDFYNDSFYQTVEISKVNEFSVLVTYDEPVPYELENIYPRYFQMLYPAKENIDPKEYPAMHCTNNVYNGHLYIVPFKNVTYIVNTSESEGLVKSVEVRNPKYFNTSYGENYYPKEIFAQDIVGEKLHKIYSMQSFNYTNKLVFRYSETKEPVSPIGDADIAKDRRGNPITPKELYKYIDNTVFKGENHSKEEGEYLKYLQSFTDKVLTGNLLFYNTNIDNGNDKNILVSARFYNDNFDEREMIFVVDSKTLKVVNKELTKIIVDESSKKEFYKNIIYTSKDSNGNDIKYLAMIKNDNNIKVINIKNGDFGQSDFPIYIYKSRNKEVVWQDILNNDTSSLFKLNPGFDCNKASSEVEETICSSRGLMTAKAYIHLLYTKKQETLNNGAYPDNVKDYYKRAYENIHNKLLACKKDEKCYMKELSIMERRFR